ncbi:DUF3995 domain-containing protein [Kitasatospora sp. NPDC048540]|uniref:DUF3995 domain-containing protein n=1 Tax=Kitasatospora sp. NPDC048540 TaxID=3155634 RepID=UPI0033C7B352
MQREPAAPAVVRGVGAVVGGALAAVGALHVVWMRSPWPLESRAEFADAVVGVTEDRTPTPVMCAGVAGLLGAASWLVGRQAGVVPGAGAAGGLPRAGSATVAGVLLVRGVAGPVLFGRGRIRRSARFVRLDRRYYAPLCVVLGAGAALVAARGRGGGA